MKLGGLFLLIGGALVTSENLKQQREKRFAIVGNQVNENLQLDTKKLRKEKRRQERRLKRQKRDTSTESPERAATYKYDTSKTESKNKKLEEKFYEKQKAKMEQC